MRLRHIISAIAFTFALAILMLVLATLAYGQGMILRSPPSWRFQADGSTSPGANAIIYWSMDTTATNSADPVVQDEGLAGSGTNDLTINLGTANQPTWGTDSGKSHLLFDGVDDLATRLTRLTPEWYATTNEFSYFLTVNVRGFNEVEDNNYFLHVYAGYLEMWTRSDAPNLGDFRIRAYEDDGTVRQIDGQYTMSTGVYYRIGAVYDTTNLYMYVNGAQVGSNTAITGALRTGGPVTLGGNKKNTGYNANVWIRDVWISTNALSTTEMTNDYTSFKFW